MELLERDAFLEALDGYLSEANGGTLRAVLVSGEAGIGKTTWSNPSCNAIEGAIECCGEPATDFSLLARLGLS